MVVPSVLLHSTFVTHVVLLNLCFDTPHVPLKQETFLVIAPRDSMVTTVCHGDGGP